jgi:hypothetical protein
MENFTIDVSQSSTNVEVEQEPVEENLHPCYILMKLEDGQIKYEMNCEEGHEAEFSILLAALKLEESFENVLGMTYQQVGGEMILANLAIVLDTLMKGEQEYSPIIHPVSVYNNGMDTEFENEEGD